MKTIKTEDQQNIINHNYMLSIHATEKQNHAKRVEGKRNDQRHDNTKWN